MRTQTLLAIPLALLLLLPLFSSARAVPNLGSVLGASTQCPNLTRNLSFGSRGNDVVQLQTFLIAQGHLAAGNDTGYYGRLTESAVKKFQCKEMNLCSGSAFSNGYGAVGPKTRAAIAASCATQQTTQPPPAISIPDPYIPPSGFACTPLQPQTQTILCPVGQTGSITQTRTSSCPGPTWGGWTTTGNTCHLESVPESVSASGSFKGSPITIFANKKFGGAIYSLTWNGIEFINTWDYGRELQSASTFDGYGECYNPTEAGSMSDTNLSTSEVLEMSGSGSVLHTKNRMAFWLWPGQTGYCAGGATTAVNTKKLSDHLLEKTVTVGYAGIPNVIEHKITFHVPENRNSATFEALTAYMPVNFSTFWTYNPSTKQLANLSDGPGEQGLPVILATPDGSYAMGVYSPEQPQIPNHGYGRFRFATLPGPGEATVKWNCVFRETAITPRAYSYVCYSIIGTLNDVTSAMDSLYSLFGQLGQGISKPRGWLDSVSCDGAYGWSQDEDTPQAANEVHLYVDGAAGIGAWGGQVTANLYRADLCSAIGSCDHGFVWSIPAQFRDGKEHSLYAYGIDTTIKDTNNSILEGSPKTFKCSP